MAKKIFSVILGAIILGCWVGLFILLKDDIEPRRKADDCVICPIDPNAPVGAPGGLKPTKKTD